MLRACIIALGVAITVAACGESTQPASLSGGSTSPAQASSSQELNPGGDIPDTQAFVAFSTPSGAFTVKVPEGWARTESGGAVTFASHFDSVMLMTLSTATQPTTATATANELAVIRRQSPHVTIGQLSTTTRTAGQAILITYQADSPPDSVTGNSVRLDVERYEFWRSGTEVVITLSAPVGADNVDPWRMITDSFTWR